MGRALMHYCPPGLRVCGRPYVCTAPRRYPGPLYCDVVSSQSFLPV
ncbi:unnamed protein product [Tetraodon nigroviridis]|uniref:(spotted green pufferfish) hypothetical protein n=1 Tax=Tetraodon nigroviridis TaxID=99883 RepID=Q4SIZ2_TETNG|nr:unnamed protein product [Tetraodon nigroviridis]